jgi:hypothetical protein
VERSLEASFIGLRGEGGGVAKAVVECFGGGGINSGGVEWRRFQEGR